MNRIALAVACAVFAVGCAHSPSKAEPAKAPTGIQTLKPKSANGSLIVIYRNVTGFMGAGAGMLNTTLYVDQKPVGDLAHDTYAVIEVGPGEHMVTARSGMGESNLPMTTSIGAKTFAQMETSPAPKLMIKPLQSAQEDIETDCTLAFSRSLLPAGEEGAIVPGNQNRM